MEKSLSKNFEFRRIFHEILLWLFLTFLLVIVSGGFKVQFLGNQTTKMLFGLADAGWGYLDQDWMANTKDPLPAFSWLVKVTYQFLNVRFFYVYQFTLVGIYLYSLVNIVDYFYQIKKSTMLFFVFMAVYLSTYSLLWPFSLKSLFHDGVANQNLALSQFLPNIFGAFLLLSVLLFLRDKPYWAVFSLVVACNVHTNYLIAGAALVSAYLVIDFYERRDFKRVIMIGGLALLLVLPIVIFFVSSGQNATAAQVAETNRIIAEIRIPHHTQVTEWWDGTAFLKTLLVLGAILVSRRTRMFPILLIGFLVVAAPTIGLFIRPSNRIAVLQLWRVSVILLPLSSAILIGAFVSSLYKAEEDLIQRWRWVIVLVLSVLLIAVSTAGILKIIQNQLFNPEEFPNFGLMLFVAENGGPGEVYLVPPKDNALDPFRLETGQPIYINWKSHPWNATEFLEWDHRIHLAVEFYAAAEEERCTLFEDFSQTQGVTNIVMPTDDELRCEGVEMIYDNEDYRLYQLQP